MRRGCLERSNFVHVYKIYPGVITEPSRRNLTDVQRYRIGERLRKVFEVEAKRLQGARTDLIHSAEVSVKSRAPETNERIAKETDLSRDKVQKMRKIENESRRSRLTLKSNKRSCI